MAYTHKDLVEIAYKWVLRNTSCGIAVKEMYSGASNGEYPDVIGFGSGGYSVLIEVKISRSDFLKDKDKRFRKIPDSGMGSQRFYCCPKGLIQIEELPEGWGLIYVNDKGKAISQHSNFRGNMNERDTSLPKNIKSEHELMYSILRRLFIKGHFKDIYDKNYDRQHVDVLIQRNCEERP